MATEYKLLDHTLESIVEYEIYNTYEFPLASDLFNKIINESFNVSSKGEFEEKNIIYKDFMINTKDFNNLLINYLKIYKNKLRIKLLGKTEIGEKILNEILVQYKRQMNISLDEEIIRVRNYSTYLKVKTSIKMAKFFNEKIISFLKSVGKSYIDLYNDEYEFTIHPFSIRTAIQIFQKGANLEDYRSVLDTIVVIIGSESFEEYNKGIITFYSELPYKEHVKVIQNLFDSL